MRLLTKLQVIFNLIETCRVCGMPVDFLFTRGQQIKVASQIYRYARRLDFCVPMRSNYTYHVEKFEGATVIEPARGFYLEPVATLDFSSLYPSIMVAHNLCYTTLIPQDQIKKWRKKKKNLKITETPTGEFFVDAEVRKGILPRILEDVVSARKQVQEILSTCTDPFEAMVLEAR